MSALSWGAGTWRARRARLVPAALLVALATVIVVGATIDRSPDRTLTSVDRAAIERNAIEHNLALPSAADEESALSWSAEHSPASGSSDAENEGEGNRAELPAATSAPRTEPTTLLIGALGARGAEAHLALIDQRGRRHELVAGADGRFEFPAIAPGNTLLSIEGVDGARAVRQLVARPFPPTRVALEFGPPAEWEIEVRDGDGAVAGARVELDGRVQLATSATGRPFLLIRADGRATFGGTLLLAGTARASAVRRHTVVLGAAATWTIAAAAPGSITVSPSRLVESRYPWHLVRAALAESCLHQRFDDLPEGVVEWSATSADGAASTRFGVVRLRAGKVADLALP
ncbi:MAG: hypothetical protein EXS13_11815 [Planctomycetes bacterium]|nr:hypothetical protein [Planctomycetota bacterium]